MVIVRSREPVTLHPRKPLTPKQRAQLALDQKGLCGCGCGEKLDHAREGTIDEHILPLWLGGTNDLSNRAIWRTPCTRPKTAKEATERGKVKRLIAKSDKATRKPPKMKSAGFRPKPEGFRYAWPKGRRIGS